MKMFVILLMPKLIASKNMLIETEDSVDANDREVSKDVHGQDYDHYDQDRLLQDRLKETLSFYLTDTLKEYKYWCATNSYHGAVQVYCKKWAKKW